jgi:hypothetical protein
MDQNHSYLFEIDQKLIAKILHILKDNNLLDSVNVTKIHK